MKISGIFVAQAQRNNSKSNLLNESNDIVSVERALH
jgi:hypothetical protein